jgi:hypothetical protein
MATALRNFTGCNRSRPSPGAGDSRDKRSPVPGLPRVHYAFCRISRPVPGTELPPPPLGQEIPARHSHPWALGNAPRKFLTPVPKPPTFFINSGYPCPRRTIPVESPEQIPGIRPPESLGPGPGPTFYFGGEVGLGLIFLSVYFFFGRSKS